MTTPQPVFLLPNQIVINTEALDEVLLKSFDEGYDVGRKHGVDSQKGLHKIRGLLKELEGKQRAELFPVEDRGKIPHYNSVWVCEMQAGAGDPFYPADVSIHRGELENKAHKYNNDKCRQFMFVEYVRKDPEPPQ